MRLTTCSQGSLCQKQVHIRKWITFYFYCWVLLLLYNILQDSDPLGCIFLYLIPKFLIPLSETPQNETIIEIFICWWKKNNSIALLLTSSFDCVSKICYYVPLWLAYHHKLLYWCLVSASSSIGFWYQKEHRQRMRYIIIDSYFLFWLIP